MNTDNLCCLTGRKLDRTIIVWWPVKMTQVVMTQVVMAKMKKKLKKHIFNIHIEICV